MMTESPDGARRDGILLAVLLGVAILTAWISPFHRELMVGDETKYSRVIHELGRSDGILVLRLGDQPYAHKPPVHFWLILLLTHLFGPQSIWPFVLPSLLFFLVLCALTAAAGRRVASLDQGLIAAAIFATFWLAWGVAQSARMEMEFVVLITAGCLLLFEGLEKGRRWSIPLAGALFGLAILVKGPMAAVIAIVLFAAESILRRRRPGWDALVALLIMAAIPLIWLIPAILQGGGAYGEELLVKQSVGRAFGSWVHANPPWFYLVRFPLTFFPWFILVVLGGAHALRHTAGEDRRRLRFLVSWFFAVFVPFSLISGKLDIYMLPAMVPASVLGARFLVDLQSGTRSWRRTGSSLVTGLLAVVFVLLSIVAPLVPRTEPELHLLDRYDVQGLFWSGAVVALGGLLLLRRLASRPMARAAVAGGVALWPLVYIVIVLIPLVNQTSTTAPLVRELERTGVPPEEIALYWTPHLWSRDMPAEFQKVRYVSPEGLAEDPARIVVVRSDRAAALGETLDRYERISSLRMISKDFDVYELGDRP
jgi:4-amino-4-deoxy-L-arabinose transferase-like glycosyltransferase